VPKREDPRYMEQEERNVPEKSQRAARKCRAKLRVFLKRSRANTIGV
jgi:hypothetical protein